MRAFALVLGVSLLVSACGSSSDDGTKERLAGDLVTCKNEQLNLKEQLADAKAQLAKALATAGGVARLDPVELKAGGAHHAEGNIPPAAVIKVVRQNSGGLRACYNRALRRKPDLQYVSSVTARFEVRNNGTAGGVTFAPHTDAEMERCMAATMEKWHFPTFQGDPVVFEQPVNLVAK